MPSQLVRPPYLLSARLRVNKRGQPGPSECKRDERKQHPPQLNGELGRQPSPPPRISLAMDTGLCPKNEASQPRSRVALHVLPAAFHKKSRVIMSATYSRGRWDGRMMVTYGTLPRQKRRSLPKSQRLSLGHSRCRLRRSISHSTLRLTPVFTSP